MAYRRRFRRSFRSGRRFVRRGFRRGGGSGMLKFGAGVAGGFLLPQFHPLQDTIITALAVVPVRTPYGIKKIAQGYVMGKLLKSFMGSSGTATGGDFV